MTLNKEGYYSLRSILGYNAKYNGILSDRGRGKSWAIKWFLLMTEGTAMCLYRNGTDMQHALESFIDPYMKGDDEHEKIAGERFEYVGDQKLGGIMYFDGSPKFWFRTLSGVNAIKQEVFPDDMNWVWLDEFIPMAYKKLPGVDDEGDALRAIVKTIEHDTNLTREDKGLKPVRVLMVGNPFTWNNPILSYFHFDARAGYGIHRAGPGVVYENLIPIPEKKRGKMSVDEFLGNEVNRNQGWLKQDAFVAALPKGSVPRVSFRFDNKYFCMYRSPSNGYWICKRKGHTHIDDMTQFTGYVGTLEALQESEMYFNKEWRKRMQGMIFAGTLRYESINTKFDFQRCVQDVKC